MDYSLAKKLKDAGFGMETITHNTVQMYQKREIFTVDAGLETKSYLIPNLEELIEACGKSFDKLWKEEVLTIKWCATGNVMPGFIGEGNTPTEAVAKLWLALHANSQKI